MAVRIFYKNADAIAAGAKNKAPRPGRGNPDRGAAPLKIVLVFAFLGAALAGLAGFFFFFSNKAAPEKAPVVLSQPVDPLIATGRAKEIQEVRSIMRSEYRSKRNEYLVHERGPEDMLWLTSQAELTLLSGLFNHYMVTTARFYEIIRIFTNGYLDQPSQLKALYEREILRGFENAERRRKLLHRRIEHDPALELFSRLDYIAYYDSIAFYSFNNYLNGGEKTELTTAVEQANNAKFMIKDFWDYFKFRLAEYRVDFKPSEDVWQRYYLPPK